MKKYLPIVFACFILNTPAQTPQEFLHPRVWLRADQFNPSFNYWTDVSGNNYNALPADSFLLSTNGLINFNKAITFDGIDDKLSIPYNLNGSTQLTIISAYHSKGALSERGVWGTKINNNQYVMLSTQRAKGPQGIVKYSEGNMNFPVINTTSQFWGKSTSGNPNTVINIGEGNFDELEKGTFFGSVSEFIVFDRLVGGVELQILQSYLSIKYGAPLVYTDYLTSKGDTIWSFENNRDFSFSIAGIGRDDDLSLYQKQSYCTSEPDFLTIGVGQIAESNDANTFTIAKNNFLIWGDNGNELKLEKVADEKYPYKLPLLDRKWLMSAKGNTVSTLPTQIKLYVKELLSDPPKCFLVIDRSGYGNFSSQSVEYIPASRITETGYAYFDNVKWDVDKSGKDVFTFSFGMDNGATSSSPNCFNESTGSINIAVQGGVPPYSFVLKNDSLLFDKRWTSESRKHVIENLSAGKYKLTVYDSGNDVANSTIKINNGEEFSLGLEEKYTIQLGKWVDFDFETINSYAGAKFIWEGNNGFYSTSGKVRIYDPGNYTVSVTNSSGCLAKESFTVQAPEKVFYSYQLFPNPSNGDYKITVALASKSDITVKIFNAQGVLIREKFISQSSRAAFDGYIEQSGVYLIEIDTKYGKEVFKLIVN